MILQQNEALVQRQITQANTEAAETQSAIQKLTMRMDAHHDSSARHSEGELIQELEAQQATNRVLEDMCEEALSATTQERTGQKSKVSKQLTIAPRLLDSSTLPVINGILIRTSRRYMRITGVPHSQR